MSDLDDLEHRSQALEKIRSDLRNKLDNCIKMVAKPIRVITYKAPFVLSPSEETAMKKQIRASHGDRLGLKISFTIVTYQRRSPITAIIVSTRRKSPW